MINARLCKKLRLAFFFASPRDCVFSAASSRHSDSSCSDVFSKRKQTNQDSEKEKCDCEAHVTAKKQDCETFEIQ